MPSFDEAALAKDRRLVAAMAAGETAALRELHAIHLGALLGIAMRVLRDREEAQEVVQDTFAKAWRQAAAYRPDRGEVFAWLVFIARNGAIDRLRRRSRRQEVLAEWRDEADPADALRTLLSEQRDWIEHHLGGLSPEQKEALELAFFGGCTQAEIAQRMETSVGNVKNHLRRGLLRLRQTVLS